MREWRNRMQISFEEEQQVFHLYNDKISYVIQVEKQRYLKHCYYGKRIKRWHSGIKDYYYDRGFCANPVEEDRTFSLDTQLREFPESGQGDFRSPAYELEDRNGDRNAKKHYNYYSLKYNLPKLCPNLPPQIHSLQYFLTSLINTKCYKERVSHLEEVKLPVLHV